MGTSMSTFRISQPTAPPPMPFNVPAPAPFPFIVPFGASNPPLTSRPIDPVLLGLVFPSSSSSSAPQPLVAPASRPVTIENYQAIPDVKGRDVSEEGNTGSSLGVSVSTEASSSSLTASNKPPGGSNNRLNRLTRSNRVDLALTLLQDGDIDFAEFLC